MDDKLSTVICGALLHDIGKLLMRADNAKCDHSSYGRDFIKNDKFKIEKRESVLNCILYHHKDRLKNANIKNDDLAFLVYEADNIASGTDRRSDEGNEQRGFDKNLNLRSIFNLLNTTEINNKERYPLRPLDGQTEINYPIADGEGITTWGEYSRLKTIFEDNLEEMHCILDNPNSILSLLEACTSYIPSSTNTDEIPDISLYDHLKLTAAIASCMYFYFKENNITEYKEYCFGRKNSKFREEQGFLMVSGDLSGIQDFIYTISSKGALKSLRGRSFYLEIMLEHIVDEILESVGISRANLLYTGGGHFYILLPNTNEVVMLLEKTKLKVNDWFLKFYSTSLYIEIAWTECSANDLMNPQDSESKKRSNRTGNIFKSLSNKLSHQKLRRYNKEQLKSVLNPEGEYNKLFQNTTECAICHTSRHKVEERDINSVDGKKVLVCKNCKSLFDVGRKLIEKSEKVIMGIRLQKPDTAQTIYLEVPSISSEKRYLCFENFELAKNNLQKDKNYYKRLYSKNEMMTGISMATNLWMGDYSKNPDSGKTIDFEEIVSKAKGIKRLAVLRADIDNLGDIFISGFERKNLDNRYQNVTISRYATLSRHLGLFFKRYINNICKGEIQSTKGGIEGNFMLNSLSENTGKKNAVIVYSGGDDVFIVGAWNDVIELAVDLRNSFSRYTSHKLTFSAGIGLFRSGFPILQMARLTGELEAIAKNNLEKNSIALFGMDFDERNKKKVARHVYSWDTFIDKVYHEKIELLQKWFYFDEKGQEKEKGRLFAGNSFLYKLLNLLSEKRNDEGNSINIARLAYLLGRIEPKDGASETLKSNYNELREKIYQWASNLNDKKQLLTALNIIIYLYRKEESIE